MNYSRAEFRKWLESLPQDEPFCARFPGESKDYLCPIASYWVANGATPRNIICADAVEADSALTSKIDAGHLWSTLTPREVISFIDQLEANL